MLTYSNECWGTYATRIFGCLETIPDCGYVRKLASVYIDGSDRTYHQLSGEQLDQSTLSSTIWTKNCNSTTQTQLNAYIYHTRCLCTRVGKRNVRHLHDSPCHTLHSG